MTVPLFVSPDVNRNKTTVCCPPKELYSVPSGLFRIHSDFYNQRFRGIHFQQYAFWGLQIYRAWLLVGLGIQYT